MSIDWNKTLQEIPAIDTWIDEIESAPPYVKCIVYSALSEEKAVSIFENGWVWIEFIEEEEEKYYLLDEVTLTTEETICLIALQASIKA